MKTLFLKKPQEEDPVATAVAVTGIPMYEQAYAVPVLQTYVMSADKEETGHEKKEQHNNDVQPIPTAPPMEFEQKEETKEDVCQNEIEDDWQTLDTAVINSMKSAEAMGKFSLSDLKYCKKRYAQRLFSSVKEDSSTMTLVSVFIQSKEKELLDDDHDVFADFLLTLTGSNDVPLSSLVDEHAYHKIMMDKEHQFINVFQGVGHHSSVALQPFYDVVKHDLQLRVEEEYQRGLKHLKEANLNEKLAVYHLSNAAKHGHANAQYHLGNCFLNGQGVTEDSQQALKWYQNSADKGHIDADKAKKLCLYYKKIKKGADNSPSNPRGVASYQYNLAICYEAGHGVSQNIQKAIEMYQNSSEQGYAKATSHLKRLRETHPEFFPQVDTLNAKESISVTVESQSDESTVEKKKEASIDRVLENSQTLRGSEKCCARFQRFFKPKLISLSLKFKSRQQGTGTKVEQLEDYAEQKERTLIL